MKNYTIIWDFDGTILPSDPYDSEQTLLLYKLNAPEEKTSLVKSIVAKAVIYADKREWLGKSSLFTITTIASLVINVENKIQL